MEPTKIDVAKLGLDRRMKLLNKLKKLLPAQFWVYPFSAQDPGWIVTAEGQLWSIQDKRVFDDPAVATRQVTPEFIFESKHAERYFR